MTFSPNCLSFGDARRLYGPVPDESRRCLRNRIARLAAIIAYIRKLALALLFEALVRVFRAVKITVLAANDYDYRWQGDDNVYPFPSTEVYEAPLTPGQILKIAAAKKEQAAMVVEYRTAEIQPASVMPVAANGSRAWASASPTGVTTIDTKRSAAVLASARVNHPEWLLGSSKRHARA